VSYTPYDMTERGLDHVVRASVSYFNTEHEIAQLADAVDQVARSSEG
jgi:selenocysteine lyase/cysteine desulfurase